MIIVSLSPSWNEMLNGSVRKCSLQYVLLATFKMYHIAQVLNRQCMWLSPVSTQRLEEARELSSWSQLRQSTRRYLRRLRDDAQEWLSSLQLWRGDIHLIEGERWKKRGPVRKLHPQPRRHLLIFFHKYTFALTESVAVVVQKLTSPSLLLFVQ